MNKINVVIADDHELIRKGLVTMLADEPKINVAGCASNGSELMAMIAEVKPDMVITDIKMPVMDGKDVIPLIRAKYPEIRIVVLSMYDDEALIHDYMQGKIEGYLVKGTDRTELIEALYRISEGERYCSGSIQEKSRKLLRINSEDKLTPREQEIVPMVCMCYSMKEIAITANISVRTAEKFKQNIFRKTGTHNPYELLMYARRKGLFNTPEEEP
jgi:DNA-binding NarL/FixJ family response regulator